VHIVTDCEQLPNAVDQRADDDGLLWDFEAEGDVVLHGFNLPQDASECKDYFEFFLIYFLDV
jgi:hypothetical protein